MSDLSPASLLIDENGNIVGVTLDGGVYRLEGIQKIRNTGGTLVNPATEDKQDDEITKLTSIDGKDFATQTTLAAADTKLGTVDTKLAAIDAVLDSIKDTDGVKKITNELPAGTQEIGKVVQGTKAIPANAWPLYLCDSLGHQVRVHPDSGGAWRTAVGAVITNPSGTEVDLIEDTEDVGVYRLQTESRLSPGSVVNIGIAIPADPAALTIGYLTSDGTQTGSYNLRVDGDPAEVPFWYAPEAGKTVAIQTLLVVFTADDFEFDGESFGPNTELTNGIKVQTEVNSVVTDIFCINRNEDFLRVPGRLPLVNNTGPKDVLGVAFNFGGLIQLSNSTSDKLLITIRDDLTSVKLKYLTATMYGIEV